MMGAISLRQVFERFNEGGGADVDTGKARLLNHGFIGAEHLLPGLSREGDGLGAHSLARSEFCPRTCARR